jgi:virginiamycin B lyase
MRPFLWLAPGITLTACAGPQPAPQFAQPAPQEAEALPASAFLAALPDGMVKRQFIIDCTGCHTFHEGIAYPAGQSRTRESWQEAAARMVANYGAGTGFPVIGRERDASRTAQWLAAGLPPRAAVKWDWPAALLARAEIREYALPTPNDLPHDVAVDGRTVVITGMFTGRMYVLDPETGEMRTEATPRANPRAIEIDGTGNWWVVLGGPRAVARRARGGEWSVFDAGYYAHSVALAPDGGVWVNGHFTHNPELLSRIDPGSGVRRDFTVPEHPDFTSTPVPYEIRVGRDGMVWMSELQGNRIVRFDPRSEQFKVWTMPTPASGPRRLDVDPSGVVWIPAYGANKLARFDPVTEKFEEFELPLQDTAPYIVRYDERRTAVWVASGMADALFRFDPSTRRFRYYRLPTPDALVRHFTIDPATGDLWLAPGSSPGTMPSRVMRLRPVD